MLRHLLIVMLPASALLAAGSSDVSVPLFFVANQGQAPSDVRFMAQGSGLTAYFSPAEAAFLAGNHSVHVQLMGSNPSVRLEGLDQLPMQVNFLTGDESQWRVGVPVYQAVAYRELYPGIDMIYGANGRDLKSQFVVAPGADPAVIGLRYQSDGPVRLDSSGALVIPFNGKELREQAPTIYQLVDGARQPVSGQFRLANDGMVRFALGDYDPTLPLIIDPVLSYSTLLGGANSDSAMSLAVDSTGAAYIAGFTASYNFPTANPEQNVNSGGNDVFVAKLSPSGNGLVYCTYLGGSADDRANGIAVDASGAAYVTGWTTSTNFPLRNALQSKLAGAKNAFVLKLNASGNALVYSTYLGGNGSDAVNGIALDASQNAYVVGETTSLTFPATTLQKGNRGGTDAFVAKLNADGSKLVYSTYLGGTSEDRGTAIAVDAGGSAYVTGSTYSADFPLAGALQGSLGGGQDAFAAKLSADGSSLLFSTFLGGSGGSVGYPESGQGIALDAQGNAYIAGVTSSANFPLLHPLQATRTGTSPDAFVAKLTAAGSLSYSTYLGGSGIDMANAIAVDNSGSAYVVGQTFSTDLPVVNAFQSSSGGDYDAFLAKLSPTGDSLASLSYLGGAGSDTATGVTLDPSGGAYIAGWTLSANFPALNGYQSINSGNWGAFVTKIVLGTPPSAVSVSPNSGTGASQTFVLQYSDPAGASDLTSVSVLFNSSLSTAAACSVTYTRATNALALLTDAGAMPSSTITPGSGSQQNTQCTLNGATSSVTLAGNILTLNLAVSFQQVSFTGNQSVYLQAVSPSGLSGWQLLGSWTVPAGPPAPVSVTPNTGTGSSQSFSFVYADPKGYSSITYVSALINSSLNGVSSCYFLYYPATKYFYLANDNGSSWSGAVALGQSGTLQNSQCVLNSSGSAVSGSGGNLTLTVPITFQPAFGGTKKVYMQAYDGLDSGLQQLGSWTIPGGAPAPVSVTPASGTGSSQTFSLVFSDPKGYSSLAYASVLINGSLTGVGGCYLLYYPASRYVYLANDGVTNWTGPALPGQSTTLQNSQCTLSLATSSASGSGTNLTLNLAISFQAAFGGTKNVYMQAYDGVDSGLQPMGTWTVPAGAMGPVSVTPTGGSGSTQVFSFVYTDPKGYSALTYVSMLINSSLTGVGGCYLLYYPATRSLFLANDAVTAWNGSVIVGQTGTLQNSQCAINAAASSAAGSSNNLTVNLAATFQATFNGSKKIYMEANDGQDSGLLQMGSWTVQ